VHEAIALDDGSNAHHVYLDNDDLIEKKLEKTVIASD